MSFLHVLHLPFPLGNHSKYSQRRLLVLVVSMKCFCRLKSEYCSTTQNCLFKICSLTSNCQSIVIKLMNFPTLLTTTQNSNSLNQMSWYWCKKVKSCKKKIKSCLGAIVGHPPKNSLYHTMQMVLVEPCDKLIICFLWVLKGGKHNYWWHMASIIMFTTL